MRALFAKHVPTVTYDKEGLNSSLLLAVSGQKSTDGIKSFSTKIFMTLILFPILVIHF